MINSILLTNFTGFANNRFDFTEGVNVLIGKNGTGKTHVLKCLAATLQARHDFLGKNSASKEQFEYILAEDMIFISSRTSSAIWSAKDYLPVGRTLRLR